MAIRRKRRIWGKRRTRGNRGTWFPIQGTSWLGGEEGNYYDCSISDANDNVETDRSLGPSLSVHPVTQDYTQQPALSSGEDINLRPTLRDFTEGQDYLLKSLVGNITLLVDNPPTGSAAFDRDVNWQHVQVAAGFFVARAQDDDQTLPDLSLDELDPLAQKNIQNSWIWRRNWILDNPFNARLYGNGTSESNPFTLFSYLVTDNRQMGDDTAHHFHTKTRRRVKREERLWFVIASMGWDGQKPSLTPGGAQPFIKYNLDVRLFGKMMKGRTSATF